MYINAICRKSSTLLKTVLSCDPFRFSAIKKNGKLRTMHVMLYTGTKRFLHAKKKDKMWSKYKSTSQKVSGSAITKLHKKAFQSNANCQFSDSPCSIAIKFGCTQGNAVQWGPSWNKFEHVWVGPVQRRGLGPRPCIEEGDRGWARQSGVGSCT